MKARNIKLTSIYLFVPIILIAFFTFSCSNNQRITEKQVAEETYKSLIERADQLQGIQASVRKGQITWAFQSAFIDALGKGNSINLFSEETIDLRNFSLSEMVPVSSDIKVSVSDLKTIVKAGVSGNWTIIIGQNSWQYNEKTKNVTALNENAAKFLDDISLKTYHNSENGYYVSYRPNWITDEQSKDIFNCVADINLIAAFSVICTNKPSDYSGLKSQVEKALDNLKKTNYGYELINLTQIETRDPTIKATFTIEFTPNEPKKDAVLYCIEHKDKIYMIISMANQPQTKGMSDLFDAYQTFSLLD